MNLLITKPNDLERLCDVGGRLGLAQLPLFRAAADGVLALLRVDDPRTAWPARLIERNAHRAICFLIGGDPGRGYPDPAPSEWVCAKQLRRWCQSGAGIVHGAGGRPEHYREAVHATVATRRLAFVETTSRRAAEWAEYLGCPRLLLILPTDGPHPVAVSRETIQ